MTKVNIRDRVGLLQHILGHGPAINPSSGINMLITPTHDPSQPESHQPRTDQPTTLIYYTTCLITNFLNYSIRRHRNHHVLYYVRSHPHSNPYYYYPVRESNRATKCGDLLPVLYAGGVPPASSCPTPASTIYWDTVNIGITILAASTTQLLGSYNLMGRLPNRIFS